MPTGIEYKTVGYSLTSKDYRLYDAEKRIVLEKCDVMFIEPYDSDVAETFDLTNLTEGEKKTNNLKKEINVEHNESDDEFCGFEKEPNS